MADARIIAGKPRPLRERQRQRLIEATISALYVHGPSRTTVERVVAIADMSPGIVSFYFNSKAELLMAALQSIADDFRQDVLEPVENLRHDPVAALHLLIVRYLDPVIASPRRVAVWYAFWAESTARSDYMAICGGLDKRYSDLVLGLIAEICRIENKPWQHPAAIADGLIGCMELIWQNIFLDNQATSLNTTQKQQGHCLAYLRSHFPDQFAPNL
ncbi:MAG: TetR family transcriptional regulator [Candidatus Symbiobacter sp.]|nr:TetR family transcriptional regulator [Candidatus Symbiobacter sp.]